MHLLVTLICFFVFLPQTVFAEEGVVHEVDTSESWLKLGVGARVGGYGFRHEKDGKIDWNDCRMDGTGVFATLDFGDHFFSEFAFDYYHATGSTIASGMDRVSGLVLLSGGVRFLSDWFVSPYIQAGGGPELTRIRLTGAEVTTLLPALFLGVGAELNLDPIKLGMSVRSFSMGLPEHGHSDDGRLYTNHGYLGGDEHDHSHEEDAVVNISQEVAGQVQFSLRYTF